MFKLLAVQVEQLDRWASVPCPSRPRLCTGVSNQVDPAARLAMGHALGEAGSWSCESSPIRPRCVTVACCSWFLEDGAMLVRREVTGIAYADVAAILTGTSDSDTGRKTGQNRHLITIYI